MCAIGSYPAATRKNEEDPMRWVPLLLLLVVPACAAETAEVDEESSEAAASKPAVVKFGADWSERTEGTLRARRKLKIDYAAERAAKCSGDFMGRPAWSTTAHYRINGGEVSSHVVAGFDPMGGASLSRTIDLTAPGEIEIWFQTTNRWGCNVWDSDYGKNYRFDIR
jgi:hypothetical protein